MRNLRIARHMFGLKILRLLRGLTQYELSKLTKIPAPRISLLERGYAQPSVNELQRLKEALESWEDD